MEGSAEGGADKGAKWKKGEAVYPPGTVGASVKGWYITLGRPCTVLGLALTSYTFRLHKPLWTVSVHITNTGSLYGGEVRWCASLRIAKTCPGPQLYIAFPEEANSPPRVLKRFDTVHLHPDETKDVTVELSRYDPSIWDVRTQAWVAPAPDAEYMLHVGRSNRDLRLTGILKL